MSSDPVACGILGSIAVFCWLILGKLIDIIELLEVLAK